MPLFSSVPARKVRQPKEKPRKVWRRGSMVGSPSSREE
ncbi:hypothetical protein A2U01_0117129, partial [Trifolium medium]|nr:hypothetical protein [Trifolium medium]